MYQPAEALSYLSGLLTVIMGWFWARIKTLEDKVADRPDRDEVRNQLRDALQPLENNINDVKTSMSTLVQF